MCHVCRLMLNGPQQFLDHLQGKLHRTNLKKAHRRQMELKLDIEPDDKAPPQRFPIMDPPTWTGMFPMREFKLSECGTHMIHRENGWTIMDCRTEQRQRWEKIRHAERMKGEKREREETVDKWRERKRMKREGPSGVAGTHQGRDDEHPQDGHGLLPAGRGCEKLREGGGALPFLLR